MSFSSMLQMARGREQPPQNASSIDPSRAQKPQAQGRPESAPAKSSGNRPPASAPSKAKAPQFVASPSFSTTSIKPVSVSPPVNRTNASDKTSRPARQSLKVQSPTQTQASSRRYATPPRAGTESPQSTPSPGGTQRKKLSFKDVMKQASQVDTTKLEVNLRTKDSRKQSESTPSTRKTRLRPKDSPSQNSKDQAIDLKPKLPATSNLASKMQRSGPAPVAQPLPEVLRKRQRQLEARAGPARKRIEEEEELDDFVVSEEDEDAAPHEEIWRLFNRGPKKRYVDEYDSDDDMEARGDEILNEERRSALQARREDAEEERKLAELAARKKQQQSRKRS